MKRGIRKGNCNEIVNFCSWSFRLLHRVYNHAEAKKIGKSHFQLDINIYFLQSMQYWWCGLDLSKMAFSQVMRSQFIGHHCANIDPQITKLVIWLWAMTSMKIATSPPPKKNPTTFIVWSSILSGPMFTSGSSRYISFLLSSVKNLFLKGSFLGPIFFSHPSRIKSLVSSSANWKIKILFLNPTLWSILTSSFY